MSRKKIIAIFLLLWNFGLVKAQGLEGKIVYDYYLKMENVGISREAILLFNDTASVFYHSRGNGVVAVDIEGNVGGIDLTYTTGPDHDGSPVVDFYKQDEIGSTYYYSNNDSLLHAREIIYFRSFNYTETKDVFVDWNLVDSSKVIGEYICRGARTEFRGRKYFAWYTPEIPLNLGPWKLRGLPGAILEVVDSDQRVSFKAKTIYFKLNRDEQQQIHPPDIGKNSISFEEFKNIYHSEQLKMVRRFSSTDERETDGGPIEKNPTLEIFRN